MSVKKDNEIWLVDPDEVTLYRVISDKEEQVIPIKGNKVMKKFMCTSGEELIDAAEGVIINGK